MTIQGLLDKVKTVNLREEVPVIIKRTSAELILFNQLQLYTKGQDSLGSKLAPYKSIAYAHKKEAMNPQPGYGNPDGKLTGEFYQGFYVEADQKVFGVDSKDGKSDKLKKQYGDTIFGLDQENKKKYSLGPVFNGVRKYITFKTGLVFK